MPSAEIHLWYESPAALMADPAVVQAISRWLSTEETARWNRFRFEKDRQLYLTAHVLLRGVLSRYVSVHPAAWQFASGPQGKPAISSPAVEGQGLHFNLSHTQGLAAVGVSRLGEIGVDVEAVPRTGNWTRHFLAPMELAQLDELPEPERTAAFIEFWTLREAYLKARGIGITSNSGEFGFRLVPGQAPIPWFAPSLREEPVEWRFWLDIPDLDHRAAVALRCPAAVPVSLQVFPAGSIDWMAAVRQHGPRDK
jgi:4'-phosphopantetheinyl transferase